MLYEKADWRDMEQLIKLRMAYIEEDMGKPTPEQNKKIIQSVQKYFVKHINKDLFIYVARETEIVACAFLLVFEKPANLHFITGRTGTVLNVYTKPTYRRRGLALSLMKRLLEDGRTMRLDYIELKATEDGFPLYRSLGFREVSTTYRIMKYDFD